MQNVSTKKQTIWQRLKLWRQRKLFLTPKENESLIEAARLLDANQLNQVTSSFAKLQEMSVDFKKYPRQCVECRAVVNVASVDAVGIDTASEMLAEMVKQRFIQLIQSRTQKPKEVAK